MPPRTSDRMRLPVLDLRTQRTEAERIGRGRLWAYAALLGAAALMGVVLVVFGIGGLVFPLKYDVSISLRSRETGGSVLVLGSWEGSRLARPERIVAVGGTSLEGVAEPGPVALRAVEHMPDRSPVALTVQPIDSAGASQTFERRLEPMREAVSDAAGRSGFGLILVLAGIMGLLALGARADGEGPRRFVALCLACSVPLLVTGAPSLWADLTRPLSRVFPGGGVLVERGAVIPLVLFLWPVGFGWALIRLLHVFPTAEPEVRKRFPIPEPPGWLVWVARIALAPSVAVFALIRWADAPDWLDLPLRVAWVCEVGVVGAGVVCVIAWIVRAAARVLGLVRYRRDQARTSEELGHRVRPALIGLHVGVRAFWVVLASVAPILLGAGVFWAKRIAGAHAAPPPAGIVVLGFVGQIAFYFAVFAPFLGTGIAVLRGGLWDVDLLAYRTALYSLLGVFFFFVWVAVDQAVEAMVPGGITGAGPVVAAMTVAAFQGPLARMLRRRLNAGPAFEERVHAAAERLAEMDPTAGAPATLLAILQEALGVSAASLLVWAGPAGWRVTGNAVNTADSVATSLVAELRASSSALVRTDRGDLLATRIGSAERPRGIVLLGPQESGRRYRPEERRMLGVLLAPLAPLLRA